jgi:hypothetical protein
MTPREWLHITTLMAGPAEAITREQMSAMVSAARARLREVPPTPVFIEKVLYHAEAISLGVRPAQALVPLLDAVRSATRTIIGPGEARVSVRIGALRIQARGLVCGTPSPTPGAHVTSTARVSPSGTPASPEPVIGVRRSRP